MTALNCTLEESLPVTVSIQPQQASAIGAEEPPFDVSGSTNDVPREPYQLLLRVFEWLDRADISYCILHGYEQHALHIGTDVDCVVASNVTPSQIYQCLQREAARFDVQVVCRRGRYFVMSGRNVTGLPYYLALDFGTDCEVDGVPLYSGAEILQTRRRWGKTWIPSVDVEFGCYLTRSIAKGRLDDDRTERLTRLYRQDVDRSAKHVKRFWHDANADLLSAAAESGNWSSVRRCLEALKIELRRHAVMRSPVKFIGYRARGVAERIRCLWQPPGLNVVFLGPDGAGKSSIIDALATSLDGAFSRATCRGFAPPLHRLIGRRPGPTDQPHALPPRSLLASIVRAVYWLLYYTIGYANLHIALARSTLVMHDRHFVDILVDQRRYRYGGPLWLLRLIWRAIPKPDLILLLDASAEVLQSRKQEVSFEETSRQRQSYLELTRSLPCARIIDTAQPFDQVVCEASAVILDHMASRLARRLGQRHDAAGTPVTGSQPGTNSN